MAEFDGFREGFYTSQDNLRLYYRDYGERTAVATPVLCLGGLTRNSKDFHKLSKYLSADRRVICPDYRGRGRSDYDTDWRNYHPTTYLGDIRHLLTVLNLHRVVVIGTSMGGLLATGMAAMLPTAVAGVVLNDVGPDVNPAAIQRILSYVSDDRPQADWDAATAHLKEILPRLGLINEEEWQRFARNTFREGADGVLHFDWDTNLARPMQRGQMDLPDLWRLFRALARVPVAALRGANSDVLTEETFVRMQAVIPHLVAATIPDKGHTPTLDEPESRAAIARILEQV